MISANRRSRQPTMARLAVLAMLLLFPELAASGSDNVIESLTLGRHEDFSRLVVVMKRQPCFNVRKLAEGIILLELDKVGWPEDLNLKVLKDPRVKELAKMNRDGQLTGLKITLAGPLLRAHSFWLPEKNKLCLDIYLADKRNQEASATITGVQQVYGLIKRLRFGTHREFSRLVVELNKKSGYELKRETAQSLTLRIDGAGSSESVTLTTVQEARIRGISIAEKGEAGVSLQIMLAKPTQRVEHFLWNSGRWVIVDIYTAVSTADRERAEVQGQVAEAEEKKESVCRNEQEAVAEDKHGIAQGETPPILAQGALLHEAFSGPENKTENKDEKVGPAVSAVVRGRDEGAESSEKDTPGEALEALIPSLAPEAGNLLRQILSAYRAERANQALDLLERYGVRFHDQAPEVLKLIEGDLYLQLGLEGVPGSFDRATEVYQQSGVIQSKSPLQPWVLIQLGRMHLRQKHYLEAMGYLDLVLTKYSKSPLRGSALLYRGQLYLRQDRADLALEDFQEILSRYQHGPDVDQARAGTAICHSMRGEYHQAEELFALLQNQIPEFCLQYPEVLYHWGRNDLALGRYQAGRKKLFRALNLGEQPQSTALLLAHIADSFRTEGIGERAASFYRLTMKLFPESEGAVVCRARLAEQSGNVELLEEIIRDYPESEMAEFALVKMAALYYEQGDYRESVRTLQRLERNYPTSSLRQEGRRLLRRSLEKRVHELLNQGDYWQVLELITAVKLWLSPGYRVKAALWEAEACGQLNLWDFAFAAAEPIQPADLDEAGRFQWTVIMAQAYEAKGKPALAESLLRSMASTISADKLAEKLRWRLAKLYQEAGNHEEALVVFRVLQNGGLKGAARAKTLLAMGKSLAAMGKYREAEESYRSILALPPAGDQGEPWKATAWSELAGLYYQQARYQLAAQAYEQALHYGKDSTEVTGLLQRSRLAACYDKIGASTEARRIYQRLEKDGSELWQQMATISQKAQELQEMMTRVKLQ